MKKLILILAGVLFLFVLLAGGIAVSVPSVRERIQLQWTTWRADLYYKLHPPEKEVFVPEAVVAQAVAATLTAMPTRTLTLGEIAKPTTTLAPLDPTYTPGPTPTITPTPEPLPPVIRLSGTKHEYQQWNNCGPATLAIALSFWGWKGDQRDTAGWIKPNARDKNTSPEEMVAYVQSETWLKAILRVGGDLETLKRLVAKGFPVIIERGFDGYENEGWMGHYELVTGYDDSWQRLITQDALIMADFPVPYEEMMNYWKDFNSVFIVIYPEEKEKDILAALGPLADEKQSVQIALDQANQDITTQTGRELFFAWYDLGSSLVRSGNLSEAAAAYDQAFAVNAQLADEDRPWRMVWYQQGPYPAYFAQGRYQDIINLATHTLTRSVEPALEESFYWRAKAHAELGERDAAVEDLRSALTWHPNWAPALQELNAMGETP